MRTRESSRPRFDVRPHAVCGLVLASLYAGGVWTSVSTQATTLGAFELRLDQMRSPQAEERLLEFSLAEASEPINAGVTTGDTPDADAAGSTQKLGETEPAGDEKTANALKPASAASAAPASRGEAAPTTAPITAPTAQTTAPAATPARPAAKPEAAKAQKLLVPRPGEIANGYDGRARDVLNAEERRGRDNLGVEIEPGMSVVACIGGCEGDVVGIVYIAAERAVNAVASGEMTQSAAGSEDAAADVGAANAIACIAGCYDESPKIYPARAADSTKRDIQKAIDRQSGAARSGADDWLTVKKSGSAEPAARAKARRGKVSTVSEQPGGWFTRIIKANEHNAVKKKGRE